MTTQETLAGCSWHSYPKIYNVGHAYLSEFFANGAEITAEEKVDGSQFSFGVFGGELRIRSRGQKLHVEAPEKMFVKGVETAKALAPVLRDGWTYSGEFLGSAKHNSLTYGRVPEKHIILFEIRTGHEEYLGYDDKAEEAERLGLEIVPRIYTGPVTSPVELDALLDRESVLGVAKIEGVVLKRSELLCGPDGKALIAKYVSPHFREIHTKEWRKSNPTSSDVIGELAESLRTDARWHKAVQHLKESGELTGTHADIAKLFKEVQSDVWAECYELITETLVNHAKPRINRVVSSGLAEWYKALLAEGAFPTK